LNLLEQLNGTVLKAAAIFGFAAVAFLVLIALAWVGDVVLGITLDGTWNAIVKIIVLLFGGMTGAKYASDHTVSKKE